MGKQNVSFRVERAMLDRIEKLTTSDKDRTQVMTELMRDGLLLRTMSDGTGLLNEDAQRVIKEAVIVSLIRDIWQNLQSNSANDDDDGDDRGEVHQVSPIL